METCFEIVDIPGKVRKHILFKYKSQNIMLFYYIQNKNISIDSFFIKQITQIKIDI